VRVLFSILIDPLRPCQFAPDQTCRTMSFLNTIPAMRPLSVALFSFLLCGSANHTEG
jgi:hypothetical protein